MNRHFSRLPFWFPGLLSISICLLQTVFIDAASAADAKPSSVTVIAHRGGRKWAPENTMAAFRKCVENGIDGIELDIHRCKTGELVVVHDENLSRTTSGSGIVKDKTWDELQKMSAGSWFSPAFKDEKIPLLADVLKLIDGKLLLNIEVKNAPTAYAGIEDDLLKQLASYKYPDKILVSSFDHELIKRIHDKAPQYKVAFLNDGILVDLKGYSKKIGAQAWNPAFGDVRSDSIKQAHDAGVEVNVWTVNKPEDWQSAIDMGVDGICTDDPVALKEYLAKKPLARTSSSQ